jgi:hypothetical protein
VLLNGAWPISDTFQVMGLISHTVLVITVDTLLICCSLAAYASWGFYNMFVRACCEKMQHTYCRNVEIQVGIMR